MTHRTLLLALVVLGQICFSARAQAPDLDRAYFTVGEHAIVTLPGRLEIIGGYTNAMAVDFVDPYAEDRLPADLSLSTRLRLAPSLTFDGRHWPVFSTYRIAADLDIRYETGPEALRGPLAYDPIQAGRHRLPTPRLLKAQAAAVGEYLSVSFGLTRSSWGLGMLANDGLDGPFANGDSPFGFARHADRVVRAQIAVFPLGRPDERGADGQPLDPPLTVAVAADAVVEDDTANWAHGDRTWHAVGAVRGRVGGFSGGVYGVHRRQSHGEGGQSELTVLDVHARQELSARSVRLWAELEAAVVFGETTYAENPIQPGTQTVLAGGTLVRMGARSGGFGLVLEAGYASGDDNPFDTQQRAFTFDREHRVGLLMFGETLRKSTAVTAANIADPTYRATPPRGFHRAATAGAVRGAVYINPRVTCEIVEGLTAMLGYLHATSDGPYTDPFQSGLQGGTSVGPRGNLMAKTLGDEIDLGLDYVLALETVDLRLRAEFAWFDPGAVFAKPGQGDAADQFGGWLHGEVRW